MKVIAHPEDERAVERFLVGQRGGGDGRGGVRVEEEEILAKHRALRDEPARRVEGQARAVEEQLVVATDGVAIDERSADLRDEAGEHLHAEPIFAEVPGRSGDVEKNLRASLDELTRGVAQVAALVPKRFVVPDILADRQADFASVEIDGGVFLSRLKIAVLVEDIVGREQHLRAGREDFPMLQKRHGIGRLASGLAFVAAHVADEQARLAGRRGEAFEHGEIVRDEPAFVQQIARRIAGDGEFGKDDDFHPGLHPAPVGREDARFVACQVADGGIDLGEGDLHALRAGPK